MAVIRYNPFSLLNQSFFRPIFPEDADEWPELAVTDGLNVYEEEGKVMVEAALPGVRDENIDVTYEDGVLHIKGRIEEKEEEKKKNRVVHRMQKVSSFNYTTVLPRPINPESIKATVDKGVLTVEADVAEAAKTKKIPVSIKK
jgi:HSP20 family protein